MPGIRRRPSRALAAGLLLAALSACELRTTRDWEADIFGGDPFGRRLAVAALGRAPEADEQRALRTLLQLEGKRLEELREGVITSVGRIAARKPAAVVQFLLHNPLDDPTHLEAALRLHPQLLPRFVLLLTRGDDELSGTYGRILRAYGLDGMLALLRLIAAGESPGAARALAALRILVADDREGQAAVLGPAVARARAEARDDPSGLARLDDAWFALGYSPEELPDAPLPADPVALAELLESPHADRATAAAEQLAATLLTGDPTQLEPYLALGPQDPPPLHALGLLARLSFPSDVPVVREPIAALSHPSPTVRCAALLALHHLLRGSSHIPPPVAAALTDPSPAVRRLARRAIEGANAPGVPWTPPPRSRKR